MPIPKPHANESQSDFMARCMGSETMQTDYPKQDQRVRICLTQWRDRNKKDAEDEKLLKVTVEPPPADDPLEYVMSDASIDRVGDVIDPSGWQLDNFKKNPIALFGHKSDFIIGRWRDVRVNDGKLLGRLELMPPVSERLREIQEAVRRGILRAVSVGFSPLAGEYEPLKGSKTGGYLFKKAELLECSLVHVPANPNALAIAKAIGMSKDTMGLIFDQTRNRDPSVKMPSAVGEHANRRRDGILFGKHAANHIPRSGVSVMKTLSQRIEDAQEELTASRDKLVEIAGMDELDVDAIEELNARIEKQERALDALRTTEARIGIDAQRSSGITPAAPAIARRPLGFPQREVKGFDLLVRAMVVRGCSHFGQKSIDAVLDERYPGHEATAVVAKADQTVGTTGTAGWASELVQTSYAAFMDALVGRSIYPELRNRGPQYSFDGNGTVSIPSRAAGGAGGGFVAEGAPIRVGRITTAATPMTARKLGVIVPFTRELARRSTPSIEGVARQAIIDDTSAILDAALLDATAADTARPAGLLNGVAAVGVGFGGGDYQAVIEDINALMAPFDTANASDGITLIMHPQQARRLAMMPGPDGTFGWQAGFMGQFTVVQSTHATAGRLIALRNADFVTASGDAPEFDVSEQATVHMEDTTPLEIVSGTGPTTADPVRSFFQTATIGVRMLMQMSWMMRRTGMVQWVNGTSW